MSHLFRAGRFVGREGELAVLREAIARLRAGTGGVVLVEGEPGIGKSALVAAAAEVAGESGCTVLSGTADQATHPLPLRLLFDCLGITRRAPDPRRSEIARFAGDRWPDAFMNDVAHAAVAEMLISLVDELCVGAQNVMILDDLQWADDVSLDVCRRLASAAAQLPLLLVLAFRPVPRGDGMRQLLAAVHGPATTVIEVGPLDRDAIRDLVAEAAGAQPGPLLTELAAQASGNPLYVCELVESLVREGQLAVGEHAELRESSPGTVPRSLRAALDNRLSFVRAESLDMLRVAALLGGEFAVTEVAALSGRSIFHLSDDLQEAVAAGILVDAGHRMRFRHPLIRQALYDGMPAALRVALHRAAAQSLKDIGGVDPQRVAQQLLAAGTAGDHWARRWLVDSAPVLAVTAPRIAAELLRRELDHGTTQEDRVPLSIALAEILLGTGEHEEAASRARQALAGSAEPADCGRVHWILARALVSGGDTDAAVATVEQALSRADLPGTWRARLLAALAMFQRAGSGELEIADATARLALEVSAESGDAFAAAYASTALWLTQSVQRRHLTALAYVDRALETLNTTADHADLRAFAMHARIFTLQNLSRMPDAEAALHDARRFLHDADRADDAMSSITAAVLMYWLGRWDDCLAELDSVDHSVSALTYRGLREGGPVWLWHGVKALIAIRRDDRARVGAHLRAGLDQPLVTVADRENMDFLMFARALAAEQDGDRHLALSHLGGLLDRRPGEMTLTHQWLPVFVRLALAVDDRSAAKTALEVCAAEAAAEQVPARATAAAAWCAGLHDGDPNLLREAEDHFRAAGIPVDLAGVLEDLAVVLADQGDPTGSKAVMGEALDLYGGFGAVWDLRRAEARLRAYGIRHGVRGPRAKRAAHGWEALTPTEQKVALLVAAGRSTPDIAQSLFLTRRTAQTHISRILAKLGMRSRVEIAREVFSRFPGGALPGQ
jgi:DNA-binding CsgD family transcriptional regulator